MWLLLLLGIHAVKDALQSHKSMRETREQCTRFRDYEDFIPDGSSQHYSRVPNCCLMDDYSSSIALCTNVNVDIVE